MSSKYIIVVFAESASEYKAISDGLTIVIGKPSEHGEMNILH